MYLISIIFYYYIWCSRKYFYDYLFTNIYYKKYKNIYEYIEMFGFINDVYRSLYLKCKLDLR